MKEQELEIGFDVIKDLTIGEVLALEQGVRE